jgi:hypothetical protein
VVVGEFREGFGADGVYRLLTESHTPADLLSTVRSAPGFLVNQDGAQMWAEYRSRCGSLVFVSDGLSADTFAKIGARWFPTVEQAVVHGRHLATDPKILVLPEAPYTILDVMSTEQAYGRER